MRRTGVAPEEASAVAATVANAFDLADLRAGLKFETAIAKPRDGRGDARLIGLTMRTGPASQLTVSRSFDSPAPALAGRKGHPRDGRPEGRCRAQPVRQRA